MEETNVLPAVVVQTTEVSFLQKDKVAVYDPFQPKIGIVDIVVVQKDGNPMVGDIEDHSNNYPAQAAKGIV